MREALAHKRELQTIRIRRQTIDSIVLKNRKDMMQHHTLVNNLPNLIYNNDVIGLNQLLSFVETTFVSTTVEQRTQYLSLFEIIAQPDVKLLVFKVLCYLKIIAKQGWSTMCALLWESNQIVKEMAFCFADRLVKIDDYLSVGLIMRKVRLASIIHSNSYLVLINSIRVHLNESQTKCVFQIVDDLIKKPESIETCVNLLANLCKNNPLNSQQAMNLNNIDILFKASLHSLSIFEFCIDLLLSSHTQIIKTVFKYPEIQASIQKYILSEDNSDSRYKAYEGLEALLIESQSIESVQPFILNIDENYLREGSANVRIKILQVLIIILSLKDQNSIAFLISRNKCIQIILDGLYVRSTQFVRATLEAINRAIRFNSVIKIYFIKYGLGAVLENLSEFECNKITQLTEELLNELKEMEDEG